MRILFLLPLAAPLALAAPAAQATVRLPALVGSHMVLQRDRPVPVWGWAAPGEAVSVTFRGQAYPASAPDASGRWQATLPPTPAGGPYELVVKGQNTLELTDVLVGDVWLASGQSNMQFKVKDSYPGGYQPVQDADQEIAAANWPRIRFFTVNQAAAYRPQAEAAGTGWQVCSPATVAGFSAVAYFFSRGLYQQYQVPVGVVVSNWGGTPAEAWVSAEGLRELPEFGARLAAFAAKTTSLSDDQHAYDTQRRERLDNSRRYDKGYLLGGQTWAAPDFDARAWPTMPLPGPWETQPGLATYDGVVWFRKEIDLSARLAGQPLTLTLGKVEDADSTYFNGVKVGSGHDRDQPRSYVVPAGLVRAGRNVIVVRVLDRGGSGGIGGEPAQLALSGAGQTLPLAGPWQYQVGLPPQDQPVPPVPGGAQMAPATLYNAMIAPLQPFAFKGVIWYQGETNVERAAQYRTLFPALITDWRQHWGSELPFLFVQLANFQAALPQPAESDWAELREAQAGALRLPRTGMATAIDIGNPDDIHPHNKQEVGRRLVLAARHVAYGDNQLTYSGPTYASMTVVGAAVRLKFTHLGTGLDVKGPTLHGFAVAGADHQFHWATARIVGKEVEVQSPEVPRPVAVRYDWASNPDGNLANRAGLPAPPFRTDTWPGITEGKK
ncbi:sialate O-acetylesterase [Hymenobacter psoromatis]|uniref:sialate O-acetylesterase n=1 Tax=Hymenobacter psoromatis TaxID=1484116 RepID=UPI001CBE5156|nr:sialate O-acetylesterase [Hymenobacter psoromatis]